MAQLTDEDLPPSLACLKNVDALLRCAICFDFLNITMMTKCSHNFCSLCIRKFLSNKLLCPVCNSQMTEQDLRNNRLLDDLVVNFQAARQQLLKANFESPPISPKTPASSVKCKTPNERSQKSGNSILNHFFQKKPRTPHNKETHQDVHRGEIQGTPSRSAKSSDLHFRKAQMSVVVKEEPVDAEDPFVNGLVSLKQQDAVCHNPGSEVACSSSPSKEEKPVIKGAAISALCCLEHVALFQISLPLEPLHPHMEEHRWRGTFRATDTATLNDIHDTRAAAKFKTSRKGDDYTFL